MPDRNALIQKIFSRNVEEVIDINHLEAALRGKKKLRVKLGIDPTAPDLHLGHAVVLSKLKEFQDAGHNIVLIIGDFTARIGDPSGKSKMRVPLTERDVKKNMKAYLAHAGKILDLRKTKVYHNSSWFLKQGIQKIIALAGASSMQQVLKRADFKARLDREEDITLLEVLYPLLQGYDSIMVKTDVELGGADQKFNLLMGRRVQRYFGAPEQDILMVPLLEGLDGSQKMSKSAHNYVGLGESAEQIFGKIMTIPDTLIIKYFMLCTDLETTNIEKLRGELAGGTNPKTIKTRLAFEIVSRYHGEKAARKAQENFDALFSKHTTPHNLPEFKVGKKEISLLELVSSAGKFASRGEARRLIEQGGVDINGAPKKDPGEVIAVTTGNTMKIGKKKFFELHV